MKKISLTLAKATPEDFKTMWAVSRAHQKLQWADTRLRERRCKMLIAGRLDQLSTGGFMRIVHGCDMLINAVCDPDVDHYALNPVYGAAPALLAAAMELSKRGFFEAVSCADATTLQAMARMRVAIEDSGVGS